jgi:ribosomal protein L29
LPRLQTQDGSSVYALAAPDVPQAVRTEAVERAEAGEHISKADAEQIIAETEREMEANQRLQQAVTNAEQQHAKDKAALQREIARIKTEQGEPDVQQAIEMFCKILKRPKLNAKQLRLLAQVLDTSPCARAYLSLNPSPARPPTLGGEIPSCDGNRRW